MVSTDFLILFLEILAFRAVGEQYTVFIELICDLRAMKSRAGRGTDGYLGTQIAVSLGAPGCDGGVHSQVVRPWAGGGAGDEGRSGSGPSCGLSRALGQPAGSQVGSSWGLGRPRLLPLLLHLCPWAACASWQVPFSFNRALRAGEPRGRQDGAAPV